MAMKLKIIEMISNYRYELHTLTRMTTSTSPLLPYSLFSR